MSLSRLNYTRPGGGFLKSHGHEVVFLVPFNDAKRPDGGFLTSLHGDHLYTASRAS